MKYEEIISLIQQGEYDNAEAYIQSLSEDEYDDIIAILDYETKKNKDASRDELCEILRKGMQYNIRNYELYICLAEMYRNDNIDQCYLSLQQALHYCDKEDAAVIMQMIDEIKEKTSVKCFSVVIASYNCKDMVIECVESIRATCPRDAYEIVVTDNASSDGIVDWLESQNDIKLIKNAYNLGFGKASNQGVKISNPDNDIFFFNSDAVLVENAVFWLRMGLYSRDDYSACGSVTNFAGKGQALRLGFTTKEEWMKFAIGNNIFMDSPVETKVSLTGFALFVRRQVLDKIGLFDEIFGIGNFEDDDLCFRILREGYKLGLCKNSFIFHYGSQSFSLGTWNGQTSELSVKELCNNLYLNNREKLREKWGIDPSYYSIPRIDIISLIKKPSEEDIKVLEIGCGMGATLLKIKALWKNSEVKGVEIVSRVQEIACNYCDIIQGDIESMYLPYKKEYFDFILCGDVLEHLRNPGGTIARLREYLKPDGKMIASIPNIMHGSALLPLLRGRFNYEGAGVLDRTHLRFFTLDSIIKMFNKNGYIIEEYMAIVDENPIQEEKELVEGLAGLLGSQFIDELKTVQYVVRVGKKQYI